VKIVALVKQVPRADAIEFDQETKSLKREGVPLLLNEFDAYAVSEAARLRDAGGGEVVAMTMGPPQAEEALRECIAIGADRCIHLSDRVFAVADTIGTSRTLAMAIRKEGADLVVCGRKTLDSETWQVPPEVAAHLRWPQVTSVIRLELADGRLRATRATDEGEETVELEPPAVLSVARPAAEPGERAPADGRIDVWTASDLVDDVRPNDKRFGQPGSPTRVLAVRDVTPERARIRAQTPQQAAERILELLDQRPAPATVWEKPERLGEKPGASYDCWTLVETVNGRATRTSLELLAKGRELAGKLGGRNIALVVGHGIGGAVEETGRRGAEAVYAFDHEALETYVPEVWAGAVRTVVERERPHVLLIPATARGRDLGPRVAGELELGMTGDCVDLGIDRAGRLIQHKPAYGGNIVSVIMGATTPQLATVRPRMFEPLAPRDEQAEVHEVSVGELPEAPPRVVDRSREDPPPYALDEAGTVVCIGREVTSADDVREIESLVARRRVAVGAERSVCAAGLVSWSRHIGLLGRAVAPRLYLALGAGADFEHLTGSVKAAVIASIGRDEAMLDAADVGLPADWRETLTPLLDALGDRL
jgi:electron transfer flavoprotein alpha/beta subunit